MHIHSPAILALLFTHKNRTIIPCVRTAEPPHLAFAPKSRCGPSISLYCIVSSGNEPPTAACCWKNGCKFGQIDDIRLSGFRSCSIPDFNTACDLRKHKSLFRGATYDAPKQGYLRRQTTDYRRLARIQGSFSNKHPLAHSPRKATSNFDSKIQHPARKNPFCDAARHANSHLHKTMTARHSPHALSPPAHYLRRAPCPAPAPLDSSRRHTAPLTCTPRTTRLVAPLPAHNAPRSLHARHAPSPPAHYAAARDNALLLPRPLPYPRTPRQLASTHRALALHATHHPLPAWRAHASRQSATHSTPAPPRLAATSPIPSFASRASFPTPSPPPAGANAGAPRRMRGFMRK